MMFRYFREKDFYPAVAEKFLAMGCAKCEYDHPFEGLELLTADVAAWPNGPDKYRRASHACELKLYPYPVGSAGYGSIGQALALRHNADRVYVGCVASSGVAPDRTWLQASHTPTMKALLRACDAPEVTDFESYRKAVRLVFSHFYRDLGLGLILVHDQADGNLVASIEIEPEQTAGRGSTSAR
jgi:hypothetical protein